MEKINIDLNSLFNLSYNFENLKLLLTTISKNQDTFENKMKDIENKIKENSKSIEQILSGEIEVNKQGNLDNINNFIIEQSAKPSSAKKENQEKNLEELTLKKSEAKNDFIDRKESDSDKNLQEFYNYKMSKENKMLLNELDNKIILLEGKIKQIYNFIPSLPQDEAKTLNDILDEFKMSLNNNHLDIKEMKENLSKIKNEIDEMNMKANDFNIYDIFKDVVDSGGDLEASKILIQALDKKTQERFKFEEEKIKNDEQEILKIKNELTNIKNISSSDKRNVNSLKEMIRKIQNEIENNNKNHTEKINENKENIDLIKEKENQNYENMNNQIKDVNNKLNNLSDSIQFMKKDIEREKEKRKNEKEKNLIPQKIDDSKFVKIDSFNELKETALKKLNTLEKKYQALNSEIKNEFFENEINYIKTELINKKPTQQEFYNLSVQVQQFSDLFETIKEDKSNLLTDMKRVKESVSFLTKKYETVILQAINITKANAQSEEKKITDKNEILKKFDEYVEISIFNEFIKEQTKFGEKLKKDSETNRHFYDEIIETLKKAASVQDLKNLEEYFVDLLDELKDKSEKLYPKRSDINKNFKAIELQIRQLYEYLNKKEEQTDNWMLAKKPIGGFSCASCETYLGDLKENNEKVFWNQLPDREIFGSNINTNNNNTIANTNQNKIGNGFSRILNLVNINKEIKNNNLFNNSLTKGDYGAYKNELIQKKNAQSGGGSEDNTIENNKRNMNSTITNNNDEKRTITKDLNINSNNITNTNYSSLPKKNSLSQEEMKFGLTSTDNLNLFRQLKRKKFNKALPPINLNKDDSNMKDINLSAGDYFEETKEIKEIKAVPKVMKIIRKKNK